MNQENTQTLMDIYCRRNDSEESWSEYKFYYDNIIADVEARYTETIVEYENGEASEEDLMNAIEEYKLFFQSAHSA